MAEILYESPNIEQFSIEFAGPEHGWLEIYFKIEGGQPFLIEASDVYPPFRSLKKWLEDMLDYDTIPSESLKIDSESYNVVLSYVFMGYNASDGTYDPIVQIRASDDIDRKDISNDYEPEIQFVVPVKLFVSKFYYSLKGYLETNRQIFRKHWRVPNGEWFDFRAVMRSLASKKIEQTLGRVDWSS